MLLFLRIGHLVMEEVLQYKFIPRKSTLSCNDLNYNIDYLLI